MKAGRALAAVLLALAMVAGPVAAARGATVSVTRDEFVTAVDRAIASAASARPSIGATRTAVSLATELDSGVLAPSAVEADGRSMDPDRTSLRGLSRKLAAASSPAERRAVLGGVQAALASLRQALGDAGPARPSDPVALKELLAGRTPSTATSTQGSDWIGEKLRLLVARLAALLGRSGSTGAGVGSWVLYGVLALAGALTLYFIARAWVVWRRGGAARDPGLAGARDSGMPVIAAAEDLPADALAFAERMAAAGRTRDAVRALYGGAARRLVEEGAVRRMRTRTNAELLRDVRASAPAAAAALAELTDRFEAAWYGHADPGDEGFRAARASFEAVLGVPGRDPAVEPGSGGGDEA